MLHRQDKKCFRYTSPLYILKGRMGEDALLRIACGKDHPDIDEMGDMKTDLAHLEQKVPPSRFGGQ